MPSGCLWNPYWAVVLSGRHGTGWQSLSNDFLWALVLWPLGPCAIIFGQLACQDVKALCGKGYPTIFYRALGYVHCAMWMQCHWQVFSKCTFKAASKMGPCHSGAIGFPLWGSGGSKWGPVYLLHLLPTIPPPDCIRWWHIGTCAMAPECHCKLCCEVTPTNWKCTVWQSLSNDFL